MKSASMKNLVKSSSASTRDTPVRLKSSKLLYFGLLLLLIRTRLLHGNPAKAERVLGWRRKVPFDALVKEMVESDLKAAGSLVEDQN